MKCKIYDCDNEAFRLGCCKKHYISIKSGYELYGLSLNISNHNSVKFLDWIYKDAHYYLSRKYEQYIAISNKTYKYPKYSRRRVHEYGDVFYDSIKDDDIV